MPCCVPHLVMKRGPSTLFAVLIADMGIAFTPVTRTSDEPVENAQAAAEVTQLPVLGGRIVRKTAGQQSRRFAQRFHIENREPGRPRTLQDWEDRPLPTASCPCYAEVVLSVPEVKAWLSSGLRSVTYRRSVASI